MESLLPGHVHAFQDWGGVPRTIKFDNMASVVSERRGDSMRFHPRLLELCAHYHFAAIPCRPARGNEKGRVERAIQYIRHSFFAAHRFSSIEDLNRDAVGKQLTLAVSPDTVRLMDGDREIARHRRSYDRHARIDDPAHIAALVEEKRKALGSTTGSRLTALLPRANEFLDAAFQRGEQISKLSRKMIELLDDYGAGELSSAIDEALERQTPRGASLSLILEQRRRLRTRKLPPVDFSRHPHLQHLADLSVPTQSPEA